MRNIKQINIKNRTYYFYNGMNNLENFDSKLLKIDKIHCKGINIYYIGYITIKNIDDCENIHKHANGYIEEKNKNKYLIFDDSVNENKKVLKNTRMFGMELKRKSMTLKKMIIKKIT